MADYIRRTLGRCRWNAPILSVDATQPQDADILSGVEHTNKVCTEGVAVERTICV
jgi:hypothetical protein